LKNFTTAQLQAALIALYRREDADAAQAYRMTFDELQARMGDESFDAWCEAQGL
jgi:hypothetical protein